MRKSRMWVLALGLLATTPGVTFAAGLPFFGGRSKPAAESSATPARKTNQQTADELAAALKAAQLNGYNIAIDYKDGVATLTGSITDAGQKQVATKAAMQVPGVGRVDNQLEVVAGPPRRQAPQAAGPIQQVAFNVGATAPAGNQQVAEEIASALGQANLSGYDIEVRYQDGVAMLDGSVGTAEQRVLAEQLAAGVPGVNSVQNRLRPTAAAPAGPQGYGGPQGPGPQGYPGYPGPQGYGGPQGQPSPEQMARMRQMVMAQQAAYQNGQLPAPPQPPMAGPGGPGMGGPGMMPNGPAPAGSLASHSVYNQPNMPDYAWPSYAAYPNYAQVNYPSQYSASAWPYIGPFYPYPQVPLGWRDVRLEWDDGSWKLDFNSRTDRWWWFMNPKNW